MEGQEWLRTQLTSASCSDCGQGYVRSRIRVLAQRHDLWLVSLKCAACGSSTLGLVTVREAEDAEGREADGRALSAEFTPQDAIRLAGLSPVDADDVIEAHRFLVRFDGDFRRLFGGGEGG